MNATNYATVARAETFAPDVDPLEDALGPSAANRRNLALLEIVVLEDLVTPGLSTVPGLFPNHNEAVLTDEVALSVQVLEAVIAPAMSANHNAAVLAEDVVLVAEPFEELIAPAMSANHNEAVLADEVALNAQALEPIIAPAGVIIQ